jgi:2-polyprenyl-6-methoxyphenol hydroxylase-like FAD-dependent oxidoreductase
MHATHVPVLIAGGGTVGLSAALFLAHHHAPALVERHAALSIHPRAAGVGVRTMDLLREVGPEGAVRGADPAAAPQLAACSPTSGGPFSQDRLDPALLGAACQRGATMRFNAELSAVTQGTRGTRRPGRWRHNWASAWQPTGSASAAMRSPPTTAG